MNELLPPSGVTDDTALVELFLSQYREHTKRAYSSDVARFVVFLHQHGARFRTCTVRLLQLYRATLDGGESTIVRRFAVVRSLLTFGVRTGYLAFNVGTMLRVPNRRGARIPRILTPEQVQALWTAAKKPRARAFVRFLYASGARVSEACSVTWGDVTQEPDGEAIVSLLGKGNVFRSVRLPAVIASEVLALRGNAREGDTVFQLDTRGAHALVSRLAKRCKMKGVSPHWLRHAHASHALDNGAPLSLVQSQLGHKSLATTGIYLHARPRESSARFLHV